MARRAARRLGPVAVALSCSVLALTLVSATPSAGATGNVLLVGTYNGITGGYTSIQQAVDAAHPGDTILVAPGDWKTDPGALDTPPPGVPPAGVLVTTSDIRIIGMNRDTTVVDGTKSGPTCSTDTTDQSFGTAGDPTSGLNGIEVYKAADVWIENLTVCNFLAGDQGATGNEIWWNGGVDSDSNPVFVDPQGFWGLYLNATSTYYDLAHPAAAEKTAAQYGIFSSKWDGGYWINTYASNFNDSAYYIGACRQQCNQYVTGAWGEYSALGYSGSNSGGVLVVKKSQFDNNQDGFDTNSQNGDNPPPQNGACPKGVKPPVPGAKTCWVFTDNYVHDNNNPNVPAAGSAAAGPVGTGMSLSGARNDTVMGNTFTNNGAWGTILVPYPDSGSPCTGGLQLNVACLYDEWGDAVIGNTYQHNGFFGNPTNGDVAATNLLPGPTDCFSGNHETGGKPITSSPPLIQLLYPRCTGATVPPDLDPLFLGEVACDSGASIGPLGGNTACLPTDKYPRQTTVVMHPLPGSNSLTDPQASTLPTMPNLCGRVPANAWCD
jgi:hypothetical protein